MATLHTTTASLHAITGRGLADVLRERVDQIDTHGFTIEHDLGHHPAELAEGAVSYANAAIEQLHGRNHALHYLPGTWPWQREAWRPGDARANLVKATAILLAVIDRLDHAHPDAPLPDDAGTAA